MDKNIALLLFQGNVFIINQQYEEAIAAYDKALQIKPDLHEAWYNRGIVLRQLGRYEEAMDSFDKALQLKPNDPHAYYNKAYAYALQNNIKLTLDNIQQAIDSRI